MQVKYYPKLDDNGNKLRDFAVAALLPDAYAASKEWPFMMAAHGIGERSQGKKENLENLVLGFKQPDGTRKWAFVKDDMKKAVDQYGIVIFIPTYDNFFEPSIINNIYDFGQGEFNLVTKFCLAGFSLGGGAVVKYMTSSVANAQRLMLALPCAPTTNIMDASVVGKANLPVHFFVNTNDDNGATNMNVTKNQVNAINNTNPAIKVYFTAFNKAGHGGYDEAMTLLPPVAPGGQGVTNLTENVYEAYLDMLKNGPRPMRAGTVPPTTVPPTTQPPTTTLKAVAGSDQTVNLPIAFLDGTASTGYKSAQWRMKQAPEGVSIWHPVVESGGWITTKLNFPKEGTYVFTLKIFAGSNYTGVISEDDVTVNFTTTGTPPAKIVLQKVFIPKTGKYVYVYDDGSTETKDQ
jgi:hypothetical protein